MVGPRNDLHLHDSIFKLPEQSLDVHSWEHISLILIYNRINSLLYRLYYYNVNVYIYK